MTPHWIFAQRGRASGRFLFLDLDAKTASSYDALTTSLPSISHWSLMLTLADTQRVNLTEPWSSLRSLRSHPLRSSPFPFQPARVRLAFTWQGRNAMNTFFSRAFWRWSVSQGAVLKIAPVVDYIGFSLPLPPTPTTENPWNLLGDVEYDVLSSQGS